MSRLSGATMAASRLEGNGPNGFFPSLLLGLSAQMNLDRKPPENQHLSGDSMFPANADRRGRSALEQRIDPLLELLDRGLAFDLLAVNEEGRS